MTGAPRKRILSDMKNPFGVLNRGPMEWGKKARKQEDALRGMRRHGREDAIEDQIRSNEDEEWPSSNQTKGE